MAGSVRPEKPVPLLLALADAEGSARVAETHDGAAAMAQIRKDRSAAAPVDPHLDGEVDCFELAHWGAMTIRRSS